MHDETILKSQFMEFVNLLLPYLESLMLLFRLLWEFKDCDDILQHVIRMNRANAF